MLSATGRALFSLNSFVATMLALYIGFSVGLPRPYWAMLTVYITAQPLTGALRSKALYRMVGTVAGAAAAVAIAPNLVNAPVLLCLAMALWAGLCLYLSLLDRRPSAYAFMLAGYTAAIIGFPSVNAPEAIFDTAIARVEEIVLGIVCATVVHTVVFPHDIASALLGRISVFLGDAQTWISQALRGLHGPAEERQRRRLASDVTELHLLSAHLPFDTSSLRPRRTAVRALQDRLSVVLPLLSAVEDRLAVLSQGGVLPAEISALAADAAAWAADPSMPRSAALALQERCAALTPEPSVPDWTSMVQASALTRLDELIGALQDCRDLSAFIAVPSTPLGSEARAAMEGEGRRPLHRDHGLAALSAGALMAAVLACCAAWILTAWPEGAVAAMMATVFASFFATQDDPTPFLASFLRWTVVSLPIAGLYLFEILPRIDGFVMLAVVLAPPFLVFGYLQADPRHSGKAMAMILGVAGSLALQETFSANLPEFINGSLAQIVGIGAAILATQLVRSVSADWIARRLLRRGWRDIASLAAARSPVRRETWTSAMIDRIGLLAPRLALAVDDTLDVNDALRDLRIGHGVIDLKQARNMLGAAHGHASDETLRKIARLYAERAAGRAAEPGEDLLQAMDAAAYEVGRAPFGAERRRGLVALAGLRRALFPEAGALTAEAA